MSPSSSSSSRAPLTPKLWGYPRTGVVPLPPSDEDLCSKFIWPITDTERSQLLPPPVQTLTPPDPALPPQGKTYPRAVTYFRNDTFDPQFASGYFFHSDHSSSEYSELRNNMIRLITPPNVGPRLGDDDTLIKDPVPGMLRLLAGYPVVKFMNGNPRHLITEVCLQTPTSLQRWPKIYTQAMPLFQELGTYSFGRKATSDRPKAPAIFEYLEVHNRRSPGNVGKYDGSYNIAATNSEGKGSGLLMPAIQTSTPAARKHVGRVLVLLHTLWRLIMPLCISKLEWDVIEFHAILCNIMSFGGCKPGPTACQLNVSSGGTGGSLDEFIGPQGSIHVDQKDDPSRRTMIFMFFRLSKGSDHGKFICYRCGFYIAEEDVWVVVLVFDGRSPHAGYSPTLAPGEDPANSFAFCDAAFTAAGEPNRLVYVCYFGTAACDHTAPSSIFPPTGFANSESPDPTKTYPLNFVEHGMDLLGDIHAFNNRIARELLYQSWNVAESKGGRLNADLFMQAHSYVDERGVFHHPEVPPWNPRDNDEYVTEMTRRYQHHRNLNYEYLIPLTKPDLKRNRGLAGGKGKQRMPDRQPVASLIDKFQRPESVPRRPSSKSPPPNSEPTPLVVVPVSSLADPTSSTRNDPLPPTPSDPDDGETEIPDESSSSHGSDDELIRVVNTEDDRICDDEVEDGAEYVVEKILDVEFDEDGNAQFHVLWAGYPPESATWQSHHDLRNAPEALRDFCEKNHLTIPDITPEDIDDTDSLFRDGNGSDDGSVYGQDDAPRIQPRRKTGSATSHQVLNMSQNADHLKPLVTLLSPESLSEERDKLRNALQNAKPKKRTRKMVQNPAMNTIIGNMAVNNRLTAVPPGVWTDNCIHLVLGQVHTVLQSARDLMHELAGMLIAQAAITWQVSRSLLVLYRWYNDTGPALAEMLIGTLMMSPTTLERRFPQFSPLTKHIYAYVQHVYDAKAQKISRSRSQRKKQAEPNAELPEESSIDFTKIPDSIWGPIITPYNLHTPKVKLPVIPPTTIRVGDSEGIKIRAQQTLLVVLSQVFIHPGVEALDSIANPKPSGPKPQIETRVARCFIRGLILVFIVDLCGGDDGILATSTIRDIIQRPSHVFEDRLINKEVSMVKQVFLDPATSTAPLRLWLKQNCSSSSEIISISKEIGDIVWEGICLVNNGASFERSIEAPSKPGKHSRWNNQAVRNNRGPLISHEDGPSFCIAGVMLRECLNLARGHTQGDEHLARLVRGQNPLTSTRSVKNSDIDHFNPIRHNNQHINLIRTHLGISKLLTRDGVCALATWFGTGQGSQTVPFMKSTDMFFTNVSQAEAAFNSAKAQSLQYDNIHVWGQSCTHLTLHAVNPQTKEPLTAHEKLVPFFTEDLRGKWVEFLGDLKDYPGDPWEYMGTKHTHNYCLNWIETLGLLGFGPGSLTALQFANTLAILGFIQPPEAESMVHWINKHPDKGAYRGLTLLGFDLKDRPVALAEAYVDEAFRAVYQHFKSSLCQEDLAAFGFTRGLGVIFVEHFLCKVVRWFGCFNPKSRVQLRTIADAARVSQQGKWEKGVTVTDKTGQLFPIPVDMDSKVREEIESRLQEKWENLPKML